jgi:ethanolamine utilization microcompartment shell protein EutS
MQRDIDRDGLAHLILEPGEQLFVKSGGAAVILMGAMVGTAGEGPLVQSMLQEPTAHLEMKSFTPHSGNEYLAVRVKPGKNHEP